MCQEIREFIRQHENLVIETFERFIALQSGGLGFPTSYDCSVPRGGNKKFTATPDDFPKYLRVYVEALRPIPCRFVDALKAKYFLISDDPRNPVQDQDRAFKLGISKGEYSKRLSEAWRWLYIGYSYALHNEKHRKPEMA